MTPSWYPLYVRSPVDAMQDLLDPSASKNMCIREKSTGETFVEGLCCIPVDDAANAINRFEVGDTYRAQNCNDGSESSSRSHVIALVYVEQRSARGLQCNEQGIQTQVRIVSVLKYSQLSYGVKCSYEPLKLR